MSLRRALTESSLRPLPDRVRVLLEDLDASPRLAAHLRAVHDVAWELTGWVERHYPGAAFAASHGVWGGSSLEELLVSLADKVWKAKRVTDLEQLVTDRLAAASGQEPWEVFMALDDELNRIAADADRRLAFQSAYPV